MDLPLATATVDALPAVTVGGETIPVEPTDTAQDTGLSITNRDETATEVTAVDEDGQTIPVSFGTPDAEGTETIQVTPGTDVDGPITLTITDPTFNNGDPAEYTVEVTGHTADVDDNNSESDTIAPGVQR